ncbi:hypothetical protein [Kitasatospora sp. KL5]|uniref:hypothetical protein n=1 Tax=Kitasatospora sp. KL5 TaxID=3425125 RepID=UPI003D6ED9CB
MAIGDDWHKALSTFSDEPPVFAHQVAGTSSDPWIRGDVHVQMDVVDVPEYDRDVVCWLPYTKGSGQQLYCVVSFNVDYAKLEATDGVFHKFVHQPGDTLYPLLLSPGRNKVVSVDSFREAAEALDGLVAWLDTSRATVRRWVDGFGEEDANWQGSAANAFRAYLNAFGLEIDKLRLQLLNRDTAGEPESGGRRSRVGESLDLSREQLLTTMKAAVTAAEAWRNDPAGLGIAWPRNCAFYALLLDLGAATFEGDTISTPLGLSTTDTAGYRTRLDADAKRIWNIGVSALLDAPVVSPTGALAAAYRATTAMLGLSEVSLQMPPAPVPTKDGPKDDPKGGPKDGPKDDPKGGPKDGPKNDPNSLLNGGGGPGGRSLLDGGTKTGGGTGGPGGLGPGGLGPGGVLGPGGINGPGGNGAGTPVLDKDGKPVLDAEGKPVLLPPGGYIGAGGRLYDGNGRPVLKNGKPVVVPEGSKAAPGAGGPLGGNAKVPAGSTVRPDGTVVDPNGRTVLDSYGNPVVLGKGDTVAKDGTLLDSNGKPISEQTQRLANQRHVLDSLSTVVRPPTGSSAANGVLGVSAGSLPLPGLPGGRLTGTGTALGGRPLEIPGSSVNGRPTVDLAAERGLSAQKASAAEEAVLRGRSVATTGGTGAPMVPPMGGAGMGAGPGEKERRRTTWLAEDEEVWGTDTGAVSGVIGR